MTRVTTFALFAAATTLATPALAQTTLVPAPHGVAPGAVAPSDTTIVRDRDNTGSVGNTTVAPGATGAGTIDTDSAAGGNAGQPERRIPQGSGGSGNHE